MINSANIVNQICLSLCCDQVVSFCGSSYRSPEAEDKGEMQILAGLQIG